MACSGMERRRRHWSPRDLWRWAPCRPDRIVQLVNAPRRGSQSMQRITAMEKDVHLMECVVYQPSQGFVSGCTTTYGDFGLVGGRCRETVLSKQFRGLLKWDVLFCEMFIELMSEEFLDIPSYSTGTFHKGISWIQRLITYPHSWKSWVPKNVIHLQVNAYDSGLRKWR
jgi:hypothetical protein